MIHSVIYGNLGRNAEMKQGNGKPFAVFSVACSTGKDKTTWVEVIANEAVAKPIMQWLTKGQSVIVTCELELREFDRRDGTKGTSLSAGQVGRIRLAGSREKREEGSAPVAGNPVPTTAPNDFADDASVPF